MDKFTTENVGTVYVDSGCIMVGDPCYTATNDASSRVEKWGEFSDRIFDDKNKRASGVSEPVGTGIGLVVDSGYGDGSYPVTITRNSEGRIASVTVTFIGDEDEYE